LSGARVERRLAAIPAVDVVGCSRLMGKDDAGTLARLAGVAHAMLDDAARKRVPITASGGHHF
jgi:class 3 adenylate cyclase